MQLKVKEQTSELLDLSLPCLNLVDLQRRSALSCNISYGGGVQLWQQELRRWSLRSNGDAGGVEMLGEGVLGALQILEFGRQVM
jgi:hypothetical protein